MKIIRKAQALPRFEITDLDVGDVFTLKTFYISGNHSSHELFLKCEDVFLSLENYETIEYSKFWSWFGGAEYDDMDNYAREEFKDTFMYNEVELFDAELTVCKKTY